MYWTGLLYVLDWCIVCTGLMCSMHWTGVCTGLVCCMYWTGVLHLLDWWVAKGHQNISGGYEAGSCSGGRGT